MENTKKEWVQGYAKRVDFKNGGHVINISIPEDAFQSIVTKDSKGRIYREFTISSRREGADAYGNTHSIYMKVPEGGVQSNTTTQPKDDGAPF